MAAKICASIAPDDVQSITKQAGLAFELGADYVEIRFDFLRPEQLQAAIESAKGIKNRAIFTLRSKDQGGKFAGGEQDRIKWLYRLAEQKPMLLDVELDTLEQNDELADFLEGQKTPVLVSWHDFQKTPPNDQIADILSEMRIYSNYVKIVTAANNVEDSLRLLEMYETAIGLNPIFFAMGEAGVISRVLCTVIGNAPFTYASIEKAVAPGQLTVKQMKKLYDRMKML
ncbi:3-dehydroquinate dehydratase [Candidatus Nitrososphaera gargensis Ga9.2]|uniref:3-dehydroquinate dehydratase n=1 Tax=Nitrososphaera gargensis (strain Ga9.2) TaxID=1237085 RepID=K0IB60_NITGG|nr:type I 3-dehydroquinate dehydratase [Candidatus Nitrososphaera gargensis]AFU58561.1 3-dehydroquinate dehydratase [Candidatus Nitrososphaera gargensis Ga9.2]